MSDVPPSPERVPVALEGVPETLLIPLVGRAMARREWPDLGFEDPEAERIVEQLHFDPKKFDHDRVTMRLCAARAGIIDGLAKRFISSHRGMIGVSLGAGLDTRFSRVDDGRLHWFDFDLPEVTALKRRVVSAHERHHVLEGNILDDRWIDAIDRKPGQPLLIVVEGLLLYLQREQVKAFFRRVAERLPGAELAFDFVSPALVTFKHLVPSVSRTSARFAWGAHGVESILKWHPALKLVEEHDVFERGRTRWRALGRLARLSTLGRRWYTVAHLQVDPSA